MYDLGSRRSNNRRFLRHKEKMSKMQWNNKRRSLHSCLFQELKLEVVKTDRHKRAVYGP